MLSHKTIKTRAFLRSRCPSFHELLFRRQLGCVLHDLLLYTVSGFTTGQGVCLCAPYVCTMVMLFGASSGPCTVSRSLRPDLSGTVMAVAVTSLSMRLYRYRRMEKLPL